MNLCLRGAEDGDVNLVAFAQDIGVRGLGAIGGAENIHRCAGEERMAIDVIASGGGDMVLGQSLLQSSFSCSLSDGGLWHGGRRCGHRGLAATAWGDGSGSSATFVGIIVGGEFRDRFLCGFRFFRFFSLHLVEDGDDTALVAGIFGGRDVVHIDAVFQKAGAYLSLVEASFLQF